MKKILRIFIGVIIVALFSGTIIFLFVKSKEKPTIYNTTKPEIRNIIKKTVATGSIVPRKEIEIKPQISGIIQAIYVEPGQKVKKGDLIAKVEVIPDMISLNNAESRVNRAKLNYKDIEIDYKRQKKLFEQGVIAQADFLEAQLRHNTAKEELESAENNLMLIQKGVSKKSGQVTNTLVRSTIEGMILDVPVEEGNSVIESNTFNDGTTIATVANMGKMIFEGKVDETEVGKIREGMDLLLSIGAIDDTQFDAKLEYISPKGEEENGAIQFEIKAAVKLQDSVFIRAGYSATADIVLDRRDSVLAIEESLLQISGDSTFVEIETKPQEFEKQLVETGISDGIYIEIISGITKDARIKAKEKGKEKKKEKKDKK